MSITVKRLARALNDLEGTFGEAIRKAATPRIARALCDLRAHAEDQLRRAAAGFGDRTPAQIIEETVARIGDLLGGASITAIAKRASGPGHRDAKAPGLHDADPDKPASIEKLTAIGKEFRELAESARKACNTPNTVLPFGRWEQRYRRDLLTALRQGDIEAARAILEDARRRLEEILEDAKLDRAIGEKHEVSAMAKYFRRAR